MLMLHNMYLGVILCCTCQQWDDIRKLCLPIFMCSIYAVQEHSAEYWPTKSHEPTRYGDLLVKLEDETSTNAIVLRNFTITDTKV